jgi:hypothetical protein
MKGVCRSFAESADLSVLSISVNSWIIPAAQVLYEFDDPHQLLPLSLKVLDPNHQNSAKHLPLRLICQIQ